MGIPTWLQTVPSLEHLNGEKLAQLQTYLISVEDHPGGPYQTGKSLRKNVFFNARIYQLYKQQGVDLPGALHYVQTHLPTLPMQYQDAVEHCLRPTTQPPTHTTHSSFHLLTENIADILPEKAISCIHPLLTALERTDARGELSHLSECFANCILPEAQNDMPIETLAKANLYAWAAYSLYDTSIDEVSDPSYIVMANLLARESQSLYGSHPLVRQLFDTVDAAMLTEIESRSAVTYTDTHIQFHSPLSDATIEHLLSGRSVVHILGPLLLTKASPSDMDTLYTALSQYCAARQLLDDIHDWHEDLRQGRYTYVIHRLAQRQQLTLDTLYPTEACITDLQNAFWEHEVIALLEKVIQLTEDSEKALKGLPFLRTPEPFIALTVGHIKESTLSALYRHTQEKDYLRYIGLLQ